jgi:hypothetical protein
MENLIINLRLKGLEGLRTCNLQHTPRSLVAPDKQGPADISLYVYTYMYVCTHRWSNWDQVPVGPIGPIGPIGPGSHFRPTGLIGPGTQLLFFCKGTGIAVVERFGFFNLFSNLQFWGIYLVHIFFL